MNASKALTGARGPAELCTVYFDSSFYIELERADEPEATATIRSLWRLRIRPVVSHALVNELLLNRRGGDASERRMLQRIGELREPLRLPAQASWKALELAGEDRERFAGLLRDADEVQARAMALGHAAERIVPADHAALARDLGIPDAAMQPGPAAEGYGREIIAALPNSPWIQLLRGLLAGADPETDPQAAELAGLLSRFEATLRGAAAADLQTMRAAAVSLLDEPLVARERRGTAVEVSLTKNDNRVVEVARGAMKSLQKLANLRRDASHMHVFLENLAGIDYLHVDGPRMSQIERDAKHAIRVAGVEARCFTASTLQEVVAALELLRNPGRDR